MTRALGPLWWVGQEMSIPTTSVQKPWSREKNLERVRLSRQLGKVAGRRGCRERQVAGGGKLVALENDEKQKQKKRNKGSHWERQDGV